MAAKLNKIKKVSNINKEECCSKFNPKPWDGRILEWENKKFIKDRVFTFFYMPIKFGSVMRRCGKRARQYRTGLAFPITPQNGIWMLIWRWTKKCPALKIQRWAENF